MKYSFLNFYKDFLNESREIREEKRSLENFLEKYKDVPDAMFSFRNYVDDEKTGKHNPLIGINPKTKFSTPNGIYGYPLKESIGKYLPFASDRPIVVVYKPKPNVPVIRTSSFSTYELLQKITLLSKITNFSEKELRDLVEDEIVEEYKKNPAQTLWSLVREISNKNIHKWAKIMISLGIPILIDDNASGTIHENEPTQCVVFGKNFVEIVGVYEKPNIADASTRINQSWRAIMFSFKSSLRRDDFSTAKKITNKIVNFLSQKHNFKIAEIYNMLISLQSVTISASQDFVLNLLKKYARILLDKQFTESDRKYILSVLSSSINFDQIALFPEDDEDEFKLFLFNLLYEKTEMENSVNIWNFLDDKDFYAGSLYKYTIDADSKTTRFSTGAQLLITRIFNLIKTNEKIGKEIRQRANEEIEIISKAENVSRRGVTNFMNFYLSVLKLEKIYDAKLWLKFLMKFNDEVLANKFGHFLSSPELKEFRKKLLKELKEESDQNLRKFTIQIIKKGFANRSIPF